MKEEQVQTTELESNGVTGSIDWEAATGRDAYFKPENNKDHELLCVKWRPYVSSGNTGIMIDVIKLDGEELSKPKLWTTTSKRTIRELEPIIKAAEKENKGFIRIVFRKSLGKGQKDTDAVFNAKNLDVDLDKHLAAEQRSV